MSATHAPSPRLARAALRQLAGYLGVSALVFAVNTAVYVGFFLVTQPKYTFLSGNSLLAVLLVIECAGCFYWSCLRSRPAAPEDKAVVFRSLASCVVTGSLLLYGLHATIFTIVERSVSINVLRYLAGGESQPYAQIEKNFVETFVVRDKAVCKRLDEQMRLGNVVLENGRYSVTPKGHRTFTILDSATRVTADKNPKNAVSCP